MGTVEPVHDAPRPWCWQAVASFLCGGIPLISYFISAIPSDDPSACFLIGATLLLLSTITGLILGIVGIIFTIKRRLNGIALAVLGLFAAGWWAWVCIDFALAIIEVSKYPGFY